MFDENTFAGDDSLTVIFLVVLLQLKLKDAILPHVLAQSDFFEKLI